ncbi:hypothetical protein HY642_01095 [Candidatus Woesearchaeota archaeon]|nr:hypothetical protein [Candidatus Woesearchaeota archaeon]
MYITEIRTTQHHPMNCPKCGTALRSLQVAIEGAKNKALSYQCPKCDYFEFEKDSSRQVLEELKNTPLKIRQKIVKLSQDRLGLYLNRHIVESLGLKKGEEIYVSVPDKSHIVIEVS